MSKNSRKIRARGLLTGCACLIASSTLIGHAQAFEIFGWKFFEDDKKNSAITDPVQYDVTINGVDDDLKDQLEEASALVQDEDDPVNGDLGVVIKARDDRERLIANLYEEARYGAVVDVSVNGVPIDELPPVPVFPRDRPVPVAITVEPGPEFVIGNINLTGDAAQFDPEDYELVPGGNAGSQLVVNAADRMVVDLGKQGRPLAKLETRSLVADHDTNTVEITIGVEGGPVADLGDVEAEGSKSVNHKFIRKWSRLRPGQRYSPEEIKDATERLRKLGVFSSVAITHPERLDEAGNIPLSIKVIDGKQRYFGVGAQFSSIDGIGLSGYWGHRNLFGNAESLKISGSVSRLGEAWTVRDLDYAAAIEFSKPAIFDGRSTLNAKLSALSEHPETYREASVTAAANVSYELTRWDTFTAGGDLTYSDSEDVYGQKRYLTASLPVTYMRDASNDKLNPTEGYKAYLAVTPSYEFKRQNFFSSFEASASGYLGLGADDNVVLAAKLSAGSILFAPDITDIPTARRFFAGGGGSVRGFGYKEISPRDANGEALGGRSYLTTSLEARVKVTDTIGIVPFLDVGSVTYNSVPDFSDIRAGAGIGLRYATPFGPIRLDVAVPINPYPDGAKFGIYAGIGQSF